MKLTWSEVSGRRLRRHGLTSPGHGGPADAAAAMCGAHAQVMSAAEVSMAVAVTVEPFAALTARRRGQLDEQVRRLAAVLGVRPELTVGPVAVGPHA
ncbi:hypothetical protein [Streptomyces sp. NPDC085466]|uniref:hypothetical protein n=1 Tax=Streptomyces sp. NPDC085466 TaxID=3365725 RepID=UPI0037CDBE68